jgi:hypothetical protein
MAPTPGRVEATSCIALAVETQKLAAAVAIKVEAMNVLPNFISRENFLCRRRMLNNLLGK